MPVFLYQIGDVSFHLHDQLYFGENWQARGEAQELLWSHEVRFPDTQWQPKLPSQEISGLLMGDCSWRADQILQRLKRITGRPTDLIGYSLINCCEPGTGSCGCGGGSGCTAVWYHTTGVLKEVRPHMRPDGETIEVSITIEYQSYWRPLSRYFWEWTDATSIPRDLKTVKPYRFGMKPLPRCQSMFTCNTCRQFRKRLYADNLISFDPDFWVAANCENYPGYPDTGSAETWLGNTIDKINFVDPSNWSAPLLSIYAFKHLSQSGQIYIQTEHSDGVWGRETDTAVLDLAVFNSQLVSAGLGGIEQDDVMYLGDVGRKPGFIIRDGVILDNPRPLPQYTGNWPGYLTPGKYRFTIRAPIGTKVAYRHDGRRL